MVGAKENHAEEVKDMEETTDLLKALPDEKRRDVFHFLKGFQYALTTKAANGRDPKEHEDRTA